MSAKDSLAMEKIRKFSLFSAGVGFIPIPLADWAAVSALQLKLVSDLSDVYGVEFRESRVSSILGSLVGGWAGTTAGYGLVHVVRALPVVGPILAGLTVPATAGASTYAVGKVFMQHFAAGGTLLDFDPDKMREYYKAEMQAANAQAAPATPA